MDVCYAAQVIGCAVAVDGEAVHDDARGDHVQDCRGLSRAFGHLVLSEVYGEVVAGGFGADISARSLVAQEAKDLTVLNNEEFSNQWFGCWFFLSREQAIVDMACPSGPRPCWKSRF